jgi:hypothetical protein
MGPGRKAILKNGWNAETICKFHKATPVIWEVLRNLQVGTYVSFYVFSQAVTDLDDKGRPNETDEDNVHEFATIKCLRPPSKWVDREKETKLLMDKVDLLVPWHTTPLLRTMWKAHREGFPPDFKGFKSMLVITDGGDNTFNKKDDPFLTNLHKTDDIPTFLLKEFEKSDVLINTIYFSFDDMMPKEEKKAAEEFEKFFREERLPLKGKVYKAEDAKALASSLRKALERRFNYRVEELGGDPVDGMPKNGWAIGLTPGLDPKPVLLKPRNYKVKVQTSQSLLEQAIALEKGQYLRLKITEDGQGFEVELFNDDYRSQPHRSFHRNREEEWLLTAQQNQYKDLERELEMMLTMEAVGKRVREGGTLRYPALRSWIEVTPEDPDGGARVALRWSGLADYEAPAWGVNVAGWPLRGGRAASPVVSTWWWWGLEPPPAAQLRTLERPAQGNLQKAFQGDNGVIPLGDAGGNEAHIESVNLELRRVDVAPGQQREELCLVVRANYPKRQNGKPPNAIWVEPLGLELSDKEEEHRFYFEAGKYTGIYWPVTEDEATHALKALRVIGLEKFKEECKKQDGYVELRTKDKGPPNKIERPRAVSER